MTPPPPTGLFPPPTATTAMPGLPDNFGQPGGPAYRPTGTEGNRVQPEDYAMNPAVRQPAVPEYLRPYITDIADRGAKTPTRCGCAKTCGRRCAAPSSAT